MPRLEIASIPADINVYLFGDITLPIRTLFIKHQTEKGETTYLEYLLEKDAKTVAEVLWQSKTELIKSAGGIVVRPIYPTKDFGLDNVLWDFTISTAVTDFDHPGTLITVNPGDKKAIIVRGWRFMDVDPILTHFAYKIGTKISPFVDVYLAKDEYGLVLPRYPVKVPPEQDFNILYIAPYTGTVRMVPIGWVAEPIAQTADLLI